MKNRDLKSSDNKTSILKNSNFKFIVLIPQKNVTILYLFQFQTNTVPSSKQKKVSKVISAYARTALDECYVS